MLGAAILHHQSGRLAEAQALYRRILAADPNNADALNLLGAIAHQLGRSNIAVDLIGKAITINRTDPAYYFNFGAALNALGRLDDALAAYDAALRLKATSAEAHYNRATALQNLGRLDDALAAYDAALRIKPDFAEAHGNRGNVLQDLGRLDDALAAYDAALRLKPDFAESHSNRANVLQDLGHLDDALAAYDAALRIRPDFAEAHSNRGTTLKDLGRLDEALAAYERALRIRSDLAEAHYNRGNVLRDLGRLDEALAAHDAALRIRPDLAEAHSERGNVLQDLRSPDKALASYDAALRIKPDYAEAHSNRGNALRDLKRPEEAVASFDKAIALKPGSGRAYSNRGSALRDLERHEEALVSYDQALAIGPDIPGALSGCFDTAQEICDWKRTSRLADDLKADGTEQKRAIVPFTLLAYFDDPGLHLQCAREFIRDTMSTRPRPLWDGAMWHHDRIRIAYLSADFREHATAFLIAGLLESHDRSLFEVVGVSFGPDDRSDIRVRLIEAFDQFHDVHAQSDLEVAKLLNRLEIDIVVDLKGHTKDARLEILTHRPAPIQVSYLGYPGTTGTEFIDYVIADEIVLPFDQQPFYTEKIVHLPECYQVNDSKRRIGEYTPTRREVGLPDQGFVFCCFNRNYKITAPVFDLWMRLLGAVEGSVLWLLGDNVPAERNLRKEAVARGVDPTRLVFAERRPAEEHLARHRLADLFLDTLPYNAHTTASDALWVGLPVLTCRGQTFAARVAASLLHAVGLPELVADNLQAYETLALRLATDSSLLGGLREKLAQNRLTRPLFDTDRFCRHIESAYMTMWDLWQRGERPQSFRCSHSPETQLHRLKTAV